MRSRSLGGFGLVLFLVGVAGGIAWWQVTALSAEFESGYRNHLQAAVTDQVGI